MRQRFTHTPLLGTLVELQIDAEPELAAQVDEAVVAEFLRLDAVLSNYRPDSEFSRWQRGEIADCSPDLRAVLAAAEGWFERSGGAFHPAIGGLRRAWFEAAAAGVVPGQLPEAPTELPFAVRGTSVERRGDCASVDLNALAKGYIVDRAVELASAVKGVRTVVVNAGGDLRHHGEGVTRVGIEDPARPYDNAAPGWRVTISNQALATSSNSRRGFRVGEQWYGHVLDPQTGLPLRQTASVTAIAATTVDADALATVLGVLPWTEALDFAADHRVRCLLVDHSGRFATSPTWPS